MRKNMKHRVTSPIVIALSIILIFSLAMGLVSCDTLWLVSCDTLWLVACDILGLVDHGAKYECPEWFTSEYCSENYIAMSENYVHTKAERKCVDKNDNVIHFNGDNDNLIVYTIRGEKIEDYALGYIDRLWHTYDTRVIKSKTNDADPIYDYVIKSIEICGVKVEPESREDVLNYEDACTLAVFDETVDNDILSGLYVSFVNHNSTRHIEDKEVIYFDYDKYSEAYSVHFTDEGNVDYISKVVLRVRFEETPNIMWEAHIVRYDGNLHLQCKECGGGGTYRFISLNETVADYIESVLLENPEIYFSQNCSLPTTPESGNTDK